MPTLKESYAGVGLRHSLFLHDHPHAKTPVFEIVPSSEAGIPESFASGAVGGGNGPTSGPEFSGEMIRCTLDPGNGEEPYVGYKEIPNWTSTKSGRVVFVRSPESWQKLCTMALGRTLKRAAYPDDTNDLKAIILWRRRDLELRMLSQGQELGQLTTGAPNESDIAAAAKPTPDYEHPERSDPDDGPIDATSTVAEPESESDEPAWSEEAKTKLAPIMEALRPEAIAKVVEFCTERGYGDYWTLIERPLKLVIAFASSQKGPNPTTAASKPRQAPQPPKPPSPPPAAAPEAPAAQSGQSVTTPDPLEPISEEDFAALVAEFDALDERTQEIVLDAVGVLADQDWATIDGADAVIIRRAIAAVPVQ